MSDTKGAAAQAEDGLKVIFGRLAEFFHILDLSFIVSGTASFGGLIFLWLNLGIKIRFPFASWVAGFAIILSCYICGLISFAVGRLINGYLFRRTVLDTVFWKAIDFQKLDLPDEFKNDPENKGKMWRLYIRLWQQFSIKYSSGIAYSHLTHYWAMAATYDGLATSLLLWAVAIVVSVFAGGLVLSQPILWIFCLVLLLVAILSFRQGAKYYEFQVEDLIAALAVEQKKLQNNLAG